MGIERLNMFLVFVAGFLSFHCFSFSLQRAPKYSFMKNARSAPRLMSYDYIVIGGGTSGCPLSATLSHKSKVLLLERGGSPYYNSNITNMANFANTLLDNSPTSPTQQFTSGDGVLNARARVLGGGSALNAGFYTRASLEYIEQVGWDQKLVEESYEWVEKMVAFEPDVLEWQSAVEIGLLEAGVLPYNGFTYNHIYGTKTGGTIFDKEGHRHTAADLLQHANPRNIAVYLHATVHKILFRDNHEGKPRAFAVIFRDENERKHTAYLKKKNRKNEIILSAGAIGSPQLLMLSGLGPAKHLETHGLKVVMDQPLVGQGMADNPMNALYIPSPLPVEVSLVQVVGITRFGSYIEAGSGFSFSFSSAQRLSNNIAEFFNQSGRPLTITQEELAREVETMMSIEGINGRLRGGIILEKVMGPLSTGFLELQNLNPKSNPFVIFNYFKEPEDLRRCVEGMETIIRVINSRSFSRFRYPAITVRDLMELMVNLPVNLRPRHLLSAISLEDFCRDTVMTIWHYHGGCQVGRVVDHDYKVLGVDSLRVIDGSTFLLSPGANPQATVMMLGRYMGMQILRERHSFDE